MFFHSCLTTLLTPIQIGIAIFLSGSAYFLGISPRICAIVVTTIFLVQRKIKFNSNSHNENFEIHNAVRDENKKYLVELLMKGTVDINARDTAQYVTALHLACEEGNFELVETLLMFGADPNIPEKYDNIALHLACRNGNSRIVQALLDEGSDMNRKNRYGETPLHIAVKFNNKETVLLLLSRKALLDVRDICSNTAMHMGVRENHWDIVKILLEYGADMTVLNGEKYTVFDLAIRKNSKEMISNLIPYVILINNQKKIFEFPENSPENVLDLEKRCLNELRETKITTIGDNKIYFFDILYKNSDRIMKYAWNDSLEPIIFSDESNSKFPIFIDMIRRKFTKGLNQKDLIEKCYCKFRSTLKCDLPLICIENIFKYFNDEDLNRFLSI